MKRLGLFLLLLFLACQTDGQKVVSAVSKSINVNITKDPPKPPFLEINSESMQFTDSDGNRKIDAGETVTIRFDISNSGMGPGLDLQATTRLIKPVNGLNFKESISLGELEPGKTITVEIPVTGNMSIPDGTAEFEIRIDETNGFDSDPVNIKLETHAFRTPMVKIMDYVVSSKNDNTLQKREPFDLQILVQNIGQGIASEVSVQLPVPANVFDMLGNANTSIGVLQPNESKQINFQFIANNEYSSNIISFAFSIKEKYGKYTENKTITLTLNQQISDTKWEVIGNKETEVVIVPSSLTSQVDNNIPESGKKMLNRLALIIGNQNYSRSGTLNAQINVEYALNDAYVFREYAIKTLGVSEENIHFIKDASAGEMNGEINVVVELLKRMGSNAELILYYAGHGFPDENTRIPYLIPVDVSASNLNYAIELSDLYLKLSETGAKRITIFLDACFSGGGRNQGLLVSRQVRVKPNETLLQGNIVVFTASSSDQSSLPYQKEKHGMFTYFLLKKLQESKGGVTYGELSDYLREKVGIVSLQENKKTQDPEVIVSPQIENEWRGWTFK